MGDSIGARESMSIGLFLLCVADSIVGREHKVILNICSKMGDIVIECFTSLSCYREHYAEGVACRALCSLTMKYTGHITICDVILISEFELESY